MTITIGITHKTHYKYDRPVNLSPQTIRLRPSPHNKVPIKSYSLKIKPKDHFLNWYQDIFGNHVANVVINEKTTEFYIDIDLKAEIKTINPFDFFIDRKYEKWPFTYDDSTKMELGNYLNVLDNGPQLLKWIEEKTKGKQGINTIDMMVHINQELNRSLNYTIRMDPGVHTPEELFTLGIGSCRDFAWTLCQIFRHLGFASRFVSGYSVQLKPDIKALDGPVGVEEDIVDLHAWAEVYLPGAGWIGLDATAGLLCGEGHIPLSASPLPFQSAPLEGSLDACKVTLKHSMKVTRIHEEPRVTMPFSEAQWTEIDALGKKIDKKIVEGDMRMTMGGEPTFVSTDNRDAVEWNTGALGDEKREKAVALLFRLRERFAPNGSLHFGQGKWYGGETLPRWSFGCFWRNDGQPVWQNSQLIAEDNKNYKFKFEAAKEFAKTLAMSLEIPESCAIEAYEDVPYHLLRERILPIEGKIMENAEDDDEVRRLLKLNKKELGKPKAFVIPLIYSLKRKKWISNQWKFRSEHLLLLPGDSPAGLRLPLGSIPFVKESNNEIPPARSNFEKLGALPEYKKLVGKAEKNLNSKDKPDSAYLKKDKNGYVRTALCIEARNGKLHIFLPPISYAEHYLELIAAIETVSANLKMPVQLEGYEPPFDLRLKRFFVTPDPGVIEVNVQPATNWQELKDINEIVYDETFKTKLTAEKFMLDGRRVGTGGGNHIIAGGIVPADSPFLRRPDLLKSVITYWQNHPGLSYLFSSIFIGPTSQAPRIDEARNDSLYELEIALKQIKPEKSKKEQLPLWMVDRLLRNIMVDVTGNTHRAEICIDKLYTPEGERGRLGLVEFRGFEMTPHARMNLLQILLIRALITMFWHKPYEGKLKPLGNQLHDKYMLPEFVWHDFGKVISDLNDFGFKFKQEWFLPQYNFRFPIYGTQTIDNIELEFRMALEPWPVLGEENVNGATSRGVDAALERLQLKVTGMDENKYKITCNKYEIDFVDGVCETNRETKIKGIKFKAWNPPLTLHPHLKINTPLTFDVINKENNTSIGGCVYHVFHPGGRNYDTNPVNVNEAEGRMISRFERIGHSVGKIKTKTIDTNPDFPFTTDLRLGE